MFHKTISELSIGQKTLSFVLRSFVSLAGFFQGSCLISFKIEIELLMLTLPVPILDKVNLNFLLSHLVVPHKVL